MYDYTIDFADCQLEPDEALEAYEKHVETIADTKAEKQQALCNAYGTISRNAAKIEGEENIQEFDIIRIEC